ncbi:lecithin retinol acyltransferase family protein [Neptuniibacter sp. QD37_6]|uniref:lecithin retinol acyltransferase family protein n=1 Tax=Neptuniibacter sp. QD37_6 TaxID=3398210 RepID=UPI0039F60E7D
MEDINVKPGDIIVTNYGTYQHWSLVSDRIGADNKLMLISATKRLGTVAEEMWDTVVKGKKTYVVDTQLTTPVQDIIERARSQIGLWKYSLTSKNCEHFVKWAAGAEVTSTQVKAFGTGALLGVAGVAALSEDPKLVKFLGGALLLGGVAVMATRALEKPINNEASSSVI